MNKKLHIQGFTLIEMLIVIAVISILAGIVLVGITGFQSSARDTKRIGDLRSVQNSLELFYTRCGHYPVGAGGCDDDASGTVGDNDDVAWDQLEDSMDAAGISARLPQDPMEGKSYDYSYGDGGYGYVLRAELENDSASLDDSAEVDENPYYGIDCSESTKLYYCIGSSV